MFRCQTNLNVETYVQIYTHMKTKTSHIINDWELTVTGKDDWFRAVFGDYCNLDSHILVRAMSHSRTDY